MTSDNTSHSIVPSAEPAIFSAMITPHRSLGSTGLLILMLAIGGVSFISGMATGKTPFEVEMKLNQVVPPKYRLHAHHWLILHGRYVCVARHPLCERCLIADLCKWPGKTIATVNQ